MRRKLVRLLVREVAEIERVMLERELELEMEMDVLRLSMGNVSIYVF